MQYVYCTCMPRQACQQAAAVYLNGVVYGKRAVIRSCCQSHHELAEFMH